MIDGDAEGVDARLKILENTCQEHGIDARKDNESVAIFVPTWCIETWFAYLEGQTVDETRKHYQRLKRERDCQEHVRLLDEMCTNSQLRLPVPFSLQAACDEYSKRLAHLGG